MDITSSKLQSVRVPWLGVPQQRGTSASVDQRFVNVFFEKLHNPITNQDVLYVVKRPGYSQHTQPSGTTGVGRGIYQWKGDLYSVIGNKIYKNSSALAPTLTTSTGRCGIVEVRPGASTQYLCVNDGEKLYCIAASTGTVTTVTSNYPANTGDIAFLDGYLFVIDTSGQLWNCSVDDPTSWSVTQYVSMNMLPGIGVGLQRLGNSVVAFSDISIEYWYDAASTPGSPLARQDAAMRRVGCASRQSIASNGDMVFWVGSVESSQATVWMLRNSFEQIEIGIPPINRLIEVEATQANINAYCLSIAGHSWYILNLPTANRTFVYDIDLEIWCEWEAAAGSAVFPMCAASSKANEILVQHNTDGWVYEMLTSVYQDSGTSFTASGRTGRMDFDTQDRKFVYRFELVGDVQASTTNVGVSYSDDDYATESTARTFDMSQVHTFSASWGNFRRRSWKFSYTGANPLRLAGFELKLRMQM